MILKKVDFYLDWPRSKNIIHLRRFITENLMNKGEVIRWSIEDIKDSVESPVSYTHLTLPTTPYV